MKALAPTSAVVVVCACILGILNICQMKAVAPVSFYKPSYSNIRAQCKDAGYDRHQSTPNRGMNNKKQQARTSPPNPAQRHHPGPK